MFGLGFWELIFIFVIGLILFGPEELPNTAKTLARFLNQLKNQIFSSDFKEIISLKNELENDQIEEKKKIDKPDE